MGTKYFFVFNEWLLYHTEDGGSVKIAGATGHPTLS